MAAGERATVGTRYRFGIGGGLLADPASRSQPDGIDGPSQIESADAFSWTDHGWRPPEWSGAVVYELHLGTFSEAGTAIGAIAHLDHLIDLGVTHVEIMPVGTFGGRWGWGYDGVFWSAPHFAYGGPDELRALIDAAHAKGLAVLIDVVYNHLGPVGNVLAKFGPYFTDAHQTPWGSAINLDGADAVGVRRRIVEDATMWIVDYHADGLRIDAIHALVDDSPTHLLAELGATVDGISSELDRQIVLVAETDLHDPTPVTSRSDGGYGLTAQWADDLHHAVHTHLTGEDHGYYADYGGAPLIADALNEVHTLRGGHSVLRDAPFGRPVGDLARWHFVVSLQNHDQIGNRPFGDRLHQQSGVAAVCAAAPLILLGTCVPMLFQGEEWAASTPFPYFADHHGDLAEAIRTGRRREFEWVVGAVGADPPDACAESTYRSAELRWDELDGDEHATVLGWYRTLIGLRARHPELGCSGELVATEHDDLICLRRGAFTVACNLSPTRTHELEVADVVASSPFGGVDVDPAGASGAGGLRIGPFSAVVATTHP